WKRSNWLATTGGREGLGNGGIPDGQTHWRAEKRIGNKITQKKRKQRSLEVRDRRFAICTYKICLDGFGATHPVGSWDLQECVFRYAQGQSMFCVQRYSCGHLVVRSFSVFFPFISSPCSLFFSRLMLRLPLYDKNK